MSKSLIAVAQRLADVLVRENDALRAMDLLRAVSLLREKTAAFADLTAFGQSAAGTSDPALVSTAKRLDGLAMDNRRLLERAMVAQQRVIGIVVRAAASTVVQSSYGGRGRRARLIDPMALSTRA